jgi:SpoVK/Ycf46/Vps4 family AAA+-type ATPase
VDTIPNVLLIGMTNRRELLDTALLRPGRLEVQIEIPLPDKEGRREILQIHFDALRRKGRLSKPLCCAIDGVKHTYDDFADENMGIKSKRQRLKRLIKNSVSAVSNYDLASDSITSGFSGADLQGLVRCAGSIALARARKNNDGVQDLQVTLEDVKLALVELKA